MWVLCVSIVPLHELVFYNTAKNVSQLRMKFMTKPDLYTDVSTLVVHINGACRSNGTPAA
jgi:hypothetical protein